jgi:hypothetical protein
MNLDQAIRSLYVQVGAPEWAAANLDALVDILRDLSWLLEGPVEVIVPEVAGPDGERLRDALSAAVAETSGGPRPVRLAT